MKFLFQAGDEVFARVDGFEPFPATVESVLLNESDCEVFYYVRFHGASEIVPLDADNLQSLEENKRRFRFKYNDKELKRESKLRVDAILGADDDIPAVLMNFITVDSDFEEVSDETVKKLGLYSITLTRRMVESLDKNMSPERGESESDNDYVDIEGLPDDISLPKTQGKLMTGFICSRCSKRFRTRRAVESHKRQTLCGSVRSEFKLTQSRKSNQLMEAQKQHPPDDLDKSTEEIIMVDKSKWASRSASGYYPCKLCFRKFRSIGEAQLHMSQSHKPQQRKSFVKSEKAQTNSDDSVNTDSGEDESRSQRHSSLERTRRAEMASKFEELAVAAGLEKGASKVRTLEVAKLTVDSLEKKSEELDRQIAYLQDKNFRLKAQYLELDPSSR